MLKRTLGVPLFQEQLLRMAMIAAGFTGGEAEELRRAMGFKRSEQRMKEIEIKLRRGMETNGITGETQDKIVQSITSFALYGFPESHAASFALLAYASAYLKCHYLAAFTAAMLNNQPMGFYRPATLVKDAQRHGLKCKPIDLTRSDWNCTLEKIPEGLAVRLGMRYVKGLRQEIALEIVRQRATARIRIRRRFEATRSRHTEVRTDGARRNRRVEFYFRPAAASIAATLCGRSSAPRAAPARLLETQEEASQDEPAAIPDSPLARMTDEERLVADFRGTGMTVGPHPMTYRRAELKQRGVRAAIELAKLPDGTHVRVAGAVIARQRPGTAKGFVFLSLEDETGIANAIITPQLFERDHTVVVHHPFLLIEGTLQNQDNVVSVKAERVLPLEISRAEVTSHDFH